MKFIALVASLLVLSVTQAQAITFKVGPFNAPLNINQRVFVGAFVWHFDVDSLTGSLQATNPTCILTVPNNPGGGGEGYGPNGSILLTGSSECAGNYELILSTNQNSIGNGGVVSGTFAIIKTGTSTVIWAGTYTSVLNGSGALVPNFDEGLGPTEGPNCSDAGTLCANLPSQFTTVPTAGINGTWVNAIVELNGFTWNP
ncbi:MAG: hypothetical protein JO166_07555 [Deltaproteobacteria bacterium]|nr:hypothetical protein [Deltaproteobacteria bacterium]